MAQGYGTAGRLLLIGAAALAGAFVGLVAGCAGFLPPGPRPQRTQDYPLPHHIPKEPDGVSLRFAMVHDIIHERFARHGPAYYTERNRRARAALADLDKHGRPEQAAAQQYFGLLDDLGAGLDYLGQHDEAVSVLRDKLRRQEAVGLRERDLYTTCANLGTFLIHGSFQEAQHGDASARERLREGLDFIHQSIKVNPQAHFGREIWQAVAVEYILAALDDPEVLLRYDMVGDRLDKDIDPAQRRCLGDPPDAWGLSGANRDAAEYLRSLETTGQPPPSLNISNLRGFITPVGAEEGWKEAVKTSHRKPVPFDEPTLGIIGMWRLGGGANPHFALALGEMMLRVGQRYLAWCAYERATRMAERFWPDASIQQRFVAHCQKRQALIEGELPADERAWLCTAFEADLDRGRRYQQAYQDYEAARIAAGDSIDDPHFYDAFQAEHPPIASPVGEADKYVVDRTFWPPVLVSLPSVLLFAGIFAFVAATALRVRAAGAG